MSEIANKIANLKKRGGGISAPLFFTVVMAALGVAFIFVRVPAVHEDSLLRFAPTDTVFYTHASRNAATQLLALGRSINYLQPDEASIFSRRTEGGYVWGTVVSWNDGHLPNSGEVRALNGNGWRQLRESVYALGVYAAGPESLANNESVSKALSVARSASLAQAFIRPTGLTWPELPSEFTFESDYVAGLRFTDEALIATIFPVSAAAKSGPLGFKMPHSDRSETSRFLTAPSADLAVGIENPAFSSFEAFFGEYPQPNTPSLALEAEQKVRLAMSGGVGLTILKDQTMPTSRVAVHLPDHQIEAFRADLEAYIPLAWPTRKALSLPDQSYAVELLTVGDGFKLNSGNPDVQEMTLSGQNRIFLAEDKAGGIVLANDMALISEVLGGVVVASCPLNGSASIRFSTEVLNFVGNTNLFPSLKSVTLSQNGDNMLFLCGYMGQKVDNLR